MAQKPENTENRKYDLEERTLRFAKDIRAFVKLLPRTLSNTEDIRQLVRASGSIGANYIEANEALSTKDFLMRIKISRKESKESRFWLLLLEGGTSELEHRREVLIQEATELMMILSSIMRRSS